MFYSSYKEAHEKLGIPGSWQRGTQGSADLGITSVKLTANPKSLDRISIDFKQIYYVGIGKKLSQGQPGANQREEEQAPFFTSLKNRRPFPVLMKIRTGLIMYVGDFRVEMIRLQTSPTGIKYYQIHLSNLESK